MRHGHVKVNGKRVTIPSYTVRKEDVVELGERAKAMIVIRHNLDTIDRQVPPGWRERPRRLRSPCVTSPSGPTSTFRCASS